MCTTKDIGELFLDKSDELVLAFDRIMMEVMLWQPNDLGASIHAIVFTNRKAWLIIKPMKKVLDVKFYHSDKIESGLIKKHTDYRNKFAHHLRVSSEKEITQEHFDLLKMGYDYALKG
ncbi:MAG: DUF5655 domain-containing protein [Cyclobacteriaceae bacterium]